MQIMHTANFWQLGGILLLLCTCGSPLIVPSGIVSLMHFIYSRIPIISKGTDSRLGVGFRFGPHADLQFLVELGPQQHTQSLGDPQNPAPDPCCGEEETRIQDVSNSLTVPVPVHRSVARSPAIGSPATRSTETRSPSARNSIFSDVNLDGRKARVAAADWLGRWQAGFRGSGSGSRAPKSHQQKTENVGSTKKSSTNTSTNTSTRSSTPLLTALQRFRDLWVAGRNGAA